MLRYFLSIMFLSFGITYGILYSNSLIQQTAFSKVTKDPILSPVISQQLTAAITITPPQTDKETETQDLEIIPSTTPTITKTASSIKGVTTRLLTSPTKKPSPTITVIPSKIPSSVPKPTLTIANPTTKITVTPKLSFTPIPTLVMQNKPGKGLDADILYSLVNDYRRDHNLLPFQRDETTCAIAYNRSLQIYNEIWGSGTMHAGLAAMQLPYWITENIISYSTEQAAFQWWINDPIHHRLILGNYSYSCTACYEYNCSQVFTNYIQK